jgi:hypothetical protein
MLLRRCQLPLKKYKIQYPFPMDKYSKQMEYKLYKEVSVTDRLPQTSGYYLTNNGKRLFSDHINVWQQNSNEVPVEWWLDVVKLPNEAETFDKANNEGSIEECWAFWNGFNFLKNYLKGVKDETKTY